MPAVSIDLAQDMSDRLNIGVLGTRLIDWGGGVDLLRIILGAFHEKSPDRKIKLTLFLPCIKTEVSWRTLFHRGLSALLSRRPVQGLREVYWQVRKVNPHRIARDKMLSVLAQSGAKFTLRYYAHEAELIRLIERHAIQAIIPSYQNLGKDFPVPWVGYLPDLQHKQLPKLFSSDECIARDEQFWSVLQSATAMVVTSQAVKRDIETFYPGLASQIFVWPFTPYPFKEWFDEFHTNVLEKYALPSRYFLISSQFWRHKSHITAIEALALIRKHPAYSDIKLICTGATDDYRHPGYFAELQCRIADLGLTDAIMILGHIPKRDQIEIMKKSVGLIQPTLFEGTQGGLAVYDAVGLGIRAIVSDIPVNLEIQNSLVTFFQAGSIQDLACKLLCILGEAPPRMDKTHQLQLAHSRIASLGEVLIDAVDAAIKDFRSKNNKLLAIPKQPDNI